MENKNGEACVGRICQDCESYEACGGMSDKGKMEADKIMEAFYAGIEKLTPEQRDEILKPYLIES